MASEYGYYMDKNDTDFTLSDAELSFAWIGLIGSMPKLKYNEQKIPIDEFKKIKTSH